MALAAVAAADDPLKDYEQLEPAAVMDLPMAASSVYPEDQVEHGRYLVTLLGCGSCHSEGALLGELDPGLTLAGSRVGIATSNPMKRRHPGVVYPSNLTPDPETGLGGWSLEDIADVLRTGTDSHGSSVLPVMPWMIYSKLSADDAMAVAMYLQSLPPVHYRVPGKVKPGQRAKGPFVHFGLYQERRKQP